MGFDLYGTVLIPVGLGLFGFIEPCTIGSTLLFLRYLEGKGSAEVAAQTATFMVSRGVVMGLFGLIAALIGSRFLGLQKVLLISFGLLYIALGVLYAARKGALLPVPIGLRLSKLSGMSGSAGLGLLFALNIPACAAPLLLVLIANSVAAGADPASSIAQGFLSLMFFGLSLSLPLLVVAIFPFTRKALRKLTGLTARFPLYTGIVLVAVGIWSVIFGARQ